MIRVALVEPEIPPNTGNIARLCAATNVPLHIVGATGFRLDDRAVRRAGLDYWPQVVLSRHSALSDLLESIPEARFLYLTTKATRSYTDWAFFLTTALSLAGKRVAYPNPCSPQTGIDALPYQCQTGRCVA